MILPSRKIHTWKRSFQISASLPLIRPPSRTAVTTRSSSAWTTSVKDPFVPSTVRNRALAAWEAGGLHPITLHECRHTFASLMIAAGENPKAIQTFMGHAKFQMTFDRYGHLLPGSRDQARARMDEYLAGFPTDFPTAPDPSPKAA